MPTDARSIADHATARTSTANPPDTVNAWPSETMPALDQVEKRLAQFCPH